MPSLLPLLLLPLLLLFQAGPAHAVSGANSRLTSTAVEFDSAEPLDAERPECEFADLSAPAEVGGCFVVPGAAPEPAAAVDAGQVNAGQLNAGQLNAGQLNAEQSAAPMCDVTGASIAAVPDIPEIDRGHVEPLPCDAERLLSLLRANVWEPGASVTEAAGWPRRSAPAVSPVERFEGAWARPIAWPTRGGVALVAFAPARGLEWRPGYPSRVYRPPSPRH